jgi:hypothetical protein
MKINYIEYLINKDTIQFIIKAGIVLIVGSSLIFQFRYTLRNYDPTEKVKVYLKGAISNPEALIIAAEINIKKKKYDEALVDLKLAKSLNKINRIETSKIDLEIKELEKIINENE